MSDLAEMVLLLRCCAPLLQKPTALPGLLRIPRRSKTLVPPQTLKITSKLLSDEYKALPRTYYRRWSQTTQGLKVQNQTLEPHLGAKVAGAEQFVYVPSMMFPSGLALEHYGPIGGFRSVPRTSQHRMSYNDLTSLF